MIEAFRKIWIFAGAERTNINKSVVVKFLNAVFHMLEVSAICFVIRALTDLSAAGGEAGSRTAWTALAFMTVSIIGNAVTTAFSKNQQTHAGYFMAANERIKCQRRFKNVRKRRLYFVVFRRSHVTFSSVSLLKKCVYDLLLLTHEFLAFFQPV